MSDPSARDRSSDPGFFERNVEERKEILEGLLREGQMGAFGGPFGMGKTPVLHDLTVRSIHGIEWCGRRVERRPIVAIDCETSGPEYKRAISAIAARFAVPVPRVPQELEIYLERDNASELFTAELLKAVTAPTHGPKLALIQAALQRKPNALVLIDPLEMFFRLDTCKKAQVLELYRDLRTLIARFPCAAMLNTFNLRKRDKRSGRQVFLPIPATGLRKSAVRSIC